MKSRTIVFLAVLLLTLCLVPLSSADAGLKATVDACTAAYSNGELIRIKRDVGLLKQAELSYQEILVTPFMTIGDCKSQEDLAVLAGMYAFDSTYALVFGKQGEYLQAQRAIETELRPRMTVSPKITREPVPPTLIKELGTNMNSQETLDKIFKHAQKNMDSLLKQAAENQDIANNLIDVMYGNVVQGLYISLSLSVKADATRAVVDLYAAQTSRVKKLESVLLAYQAAPGRIGLLTLAKDTFALNDGHPGQAALKALLDRVTLEREKFATQCH